MPSALLFTFSMLLLSFALASVGQDDYAISDVSVVINGIQAECIPNEQKTKWVCK